MSDYAFYAGMLRFVVRKTDPTDARVKAMMEILTLSAAQIEATGGVEVGADRLEITARAFAGVAAFLQQRILPEVVADGNTSGEQQVRWAIDTAMEAVNTLLARAAMRDGEGVALRLGQPPG